jgi:protein-tyrosine-phosphatase
LTSRNRYGAGEAMSHRQPGEFFKVWLARARVGRSHRDLVGIDTTDDVVDPYGLPEEAYEETATEIDDFISRLVELAWPENVADNPSRLPH